MSLITRMRQSVCVYWTPTGMADDNGVPILGAPEELACRWDELQIEFINADGDKLISRAVVYVGERPAIGGIMVHATLASIVYFNTPRKNDGVFEVKQVSEVANLRNTETLISVMLV